MNPDLFYIFALDNVWLLYYVHLYVVLGVPYRLRFWSSIAIELDRAESDFYSGINIRHCTVYAENL